MITTIRPFRPEDEADLRGIMKSSLDFDAYPGFTEWDLDIEATWMAGAPESLALAVEDGVVCGFVCPAGQALTVRPEFRRRGHGRRLFAAGLELAARDGGDEIRLYVPAVDAVEAFARAMGLAYRESLWRLTLPPETIVPAPAWPSGVVARPLGDWLPVPRFVGLFNGVFAEDPFPDLTVAQMERSHSRPDFDPNSILLLSPADRPDYPIAFVRTSLGPPDGGGSSPVGTIRFVGVDAGWRGRGLGRELLRWGVAHVREGGAGRVQLTVEAENELALGLYRRTGFEPRVEWPHWTRQIRSGAAG